MTLNINDRIRIIRERYQWSQEEMATKMNMSTSGYSKIERGETKLYIDKLEKIADILKISMLELMSSGDDLSIYDVNQSISNQHNPTFADSHWHSFEIARLKLVVSHKNELLKQKDKEIRAMQEIIDLLKQTKRTLN